MPYITYILMSYLPGAPQPGTQVYAPTGLTALPPAPDLPAAGVQPLQSIPLPAPPPPPPPGPWLTAPGPIPSVGMPNYRNAWYARCWVNMPPPGGIEPFGIFFSAVFVTTLTHQQLPPVEYWFTAAINSANVLVQPSALVLQQGGAPFPRGTLTQNNAYLAGTVQWQVFLTMRST